MTSNATKRLTVGLADPTDQHADSTGCGMAFFSWLMSQGYGLDQIAQAMVSLGDAGTLAQLYANLTSDLASNALPAFLSAIENLPNGVTNDDPFGGATHPAQLPHLAPWTVELSGKIFGAILAGVAAGKSEHQIVASVRAALVSAPTTKAVAPTAKLAAASAARCSVRSRASFRLGGR
jgi:hypothetical protein